MACGCGRFSPSSSLNCAIASWISSSRTISSTRLKPRIFTRYLLLSRSGASEAADPAEHAVPEDLAGRGLVVAMRGVAQHEQRGVGRSRVAGERAGEIAGEVAVAVREEHR